jgi:hypothetical protein
MSEFFTWHFSTSFLFMALPLLGASRSHSDTSHSVGLLWTSDQPGACHTQVQKHALRLWELKTRLWEGHVSTGTIRILQKRALRTKWIIHSGANWILFFSYVPVRIHKGKEEVKQSHYRPGQAQRVPGGWGSQISRQSTHEGGKVVSPTHRPPLPPKKYSRSTRVPASVRSWVYPRAIVRPTGLCQWKKSTDDIGNRTRDLPVCSAVPALIQSINAAIWKSLDFSCIWRMKPQLGRKNIAQLPDYFIFVVLSVQQSVCSDYRKQSSGKDRRVRHITWKKHPGRHIGVRQWDIKAQNWQSADTMDCDSTAWLYVWLRMRHRQKKTKE